MNRVVSTLGGSLAMAGLAVAGASPAYAESTQVALWHMDGTSNSLVDSSGHDYSTTLKNVRLGQPGWKGTSYGFATKPAYVRVSSATELNPGSSAYAFTVHLRFTSRPSASVEDYDILRKGLSTTSGGSFKMEILSSGKAYCNFRGSKEVSLSNGPNLANDAWHTVTCRRTSSSVQLVVDGTTYTASGSTGTISNSDALYMGAKDTAGNDQFTGRLDEVSIVKG
jgi:hypothetical protein